MPNNTRNDHKNPHHPHKKPTAEEIEAGLIELGKLKPTPEQVKKRKLKKIRTAGVLAAVVIFFSIMIMTNEGSSILLVAFAALGTIALFLALAAWAITSRKPGSEFYDQYKNCPGCGDPILIQPPYQETCENCKKE